MSDDLHYLSATEAIAHFRTRELSPVELLQAVVDRTQKFEPRINAFTEEMFEEALIGAREAESRYLGHGPDPRPLEGIPVAAKEKHAIAGKSLTEGSLAARGNIARENAPVIDRVLAAGGLIHALSTVGRDSQSLEPRLQSRRFIRRRGRRPRCRNYHSGNSIRYRRVDAGPGRLHRHRRTQSVVRPHSRSRPAVHGFLPWRRSDGPNCRRRNSFGQRSDRAGSA